MRLKVLKDASEAKTEKLYTLVLTETEKERLATIVGCNADLTMEPQMKEAMKRGDAARTSQLFQAIESDRALMMKVLDAKVVKEDD